MKRLWLLRHASSGCDDMSLSDRYRPIDACGERELAWLARWAHEHGELPQCIVSSPAQRAMDTARVLADAAGLRAQDIRIDARLYEGSARRLMEVVAELDNRCSHAAVVGHNPELADLGRHLAAELTHLPSAGIAALDFDADTWRDALRSRVIRASLFAPPRRSAHARPDAPSWISP